ncbi:hypothetical protein N8D56_08100 [Devosia sp. A8/3-2]|nr:hypothetical protein N8D56_08100 [Devosia sp. A8/3-2]
MTTVTACGVSMAILGAPAPITRRSSIVILLAFVVVDWAKAAPIPTTLNAAPHISAAACDLTSPIVNSSSLFGLSVWLAAGWLFVTRSLS